MLTEERPWGSFTVIEERGNYKIKSISVSPNNRTSLQYHQHRSEHATVVQGQARIELEGECFTLNEGESYTVPVLAKHRIHNMSAMPLTIIEVQFGNDLREGDIVRVEDDYGRVD